ncbi:MAG: S41 family peptidase [Bacteroidales bacterium]
MQNSKKNKIKIYLPILFALVMALGVIVGINLNFNTAPGNENKFRSFGFGKYDKINDVINFVYESYVDSINREEITEETIKSFLSNLDPHSVYIPAEDFKELNDPLMGSFEGIGIEFNMVADTVVVINPIPGGPSEKVGIQAGDRIIKVNDEMIAGVKMSTEEIVKKLKGPKDTEVNVTIYRTGLDEEFEYTIVRDKIPSYSLDIAYMLDDNNAYIKINRFSATTHHEFITAFDRLKRQGLENLILDLRGNGGGFLEAAIALADEFLPAGEMIVYTEGFRRPKKYAYARRTGKFEDKPLVILIDEWSASASEIIAGAIQDNDKGLVIGRRSFGKGLVQEQVQLADGSALRLTVARYYTPSGRSIQSPYDDGSDNYYDEFFERFMHGEHESVDSIKLIDSLQYKTRAGRTVYAGGGIMPDIFVPFNSEERTPFFNRIANMGLIYRFAFNYTDNNRSLINNNYNNAENYINNFSINNNIFYEFLSFVKTNDVEIDKHEAQKSSRLIKQQLKAYIGRNIFGREAFYPVINKNDPVIKEAIEALKDDNYLKLLSAEEQSL